MGLKIVEENLDLVDAAFHSLYTEQEGGKFVLTGVDGMKTDADIARMNTAILKERTATAEAKAKYAAFNGQDPVEILAQLDRIPELEALATGKIDETKIESIVETRLKAKITPIERLLEAEKVKSASFENLNKQYIEKEKTLTIHSAVRKAATAANVRAEAIDDAITLAERYFELADDGSVITKDVAGVSQGIDAAMWLADLQGKKPHWWGETVGGGASGSGNGFSGTNNPWTADNWSMTEQGKMYSKNPAKAEQMAKAAGSTIGATRPTKK